MPSRVWRAVVLGAAVVGLAARLAFGLLYWVDKPLTNDELEYLTLARNLSTDHGFTYDTPAENSERTRQQQFGRAPGYPAFLALISVVSPFDPNPRSTPVAVKVVQAFVGSVGVVVIGALAARVAGPASGAVAAGIAAIYPPLVWICAYALSEALYSVLGLLSVLILAWGDRREDGHPAARPTLGSRLSAGGIAGLAALTRPVMVLFLALCTVWLGARRPRRYAAAFAIGAAVIITPWTLRNAHELGRFVLIAPQGGVNFWIGNHRLARGEGDLAANPLLKSADTELRARHRDLDATQLESIYYREAFTEISADPVRWLGLLARKVFYQWIPVGPSYTLHSPRYYIASLVSYGMVLPLAIAGIIELHRRRRVPGALLVLVASEVLAGLIFFPQERYRIPVIDPALIVCASAWIARRASGRDGPRTIEA